MLEGQVAAISSGLLEVDEVVALVETMYESDLYRADVDSFVLYPARRRPPFLERNQVPVEAVESNPLLRALLAGGNDDIIVARRRRERTTSTPISRTPLTSRQRSTRSPRPTFGPLVADHRGEVLDLFERVFNHHEFTGRSSTMYAYEGIGSVYWHMVAKLLVAVQESILEAPPDTASESLDDLIRLYDRVRSGLGFNKTAAEYGAFPTDPYSHTPGSRRGPAAGHDRAGERRTAHPLGRTRTRRVGGLDSLLVGAVQRSGAPYRGRNPRPSRRRGSAIAPRCAAGIRSVHDLPGPVVVHASAESDDRVTDDDGSRSSVPEALDPRDSRQSSTTPDRALDVFVARCSIP